MVFINQVIVVFVDLKNTIERDVVKSEMKTILSIDPGIRGCGVATYVDGKLYSCAYVKSPTKTGHGPRESERVATAVLRWWWDVWGYCSKLDILVLEYPQIYQRGENRTKGDPNVCVLPLVGVVCALAALFPESEVVAVQPSAWKGGVPKEDERGDNVVLGRLRERLSPEELVVLERGLKEAGALGHNVVDGVSLGAWSLGRFKRKRVITR